ncbi:MAG TPA: TrmH family RNA methyltransferase [Candidatus Handelsmanbacteria bacterium]|jgi:tRNA (guanosine-2'-O-)-methyltransferase|nr:tRNA methyltransferase [Candidatus Latescibacterota bacterium]HIG18847.1 TrmH family RNA methyltransferase [Candidatus Handelsmanbacteria bacterium]
MLPLRKVEIRRLFEQAAKDFPPQAEVAFLLQSLDDPRNVGSLFRIADAMGARELVFTGKTPTPPDDEIDRTSRGHDRRVSWRRIADTHEAVATLKAEGYQVVALETARGTQPFFEFAWSDRVCLVLGNETNGVYAGTLGQCDGAVFVPMYGKGPSMNVHVAAALVAYQVILHGGAGDSR